ncbi:LysR substrate binding domain protein [compost metagenome]
MEKIKSLKQGFIYNPKYFQDIESIEDLKNFSLILQKKESNSRKLLDSNMHKNNIILIPKMEVVSQELVTEFTNIGLGIGFTTIDSAIASHPNLKELSINKSLSTTDIYLATNKSINLTFASKKLLNYIKEITK